MNDFTRNELFDIAKSLKIEKYTTFSKQELINAISKQLSMKKEDESYKRISKNKYKTQEQLGNTGKDAKTYRVTDKFGNEYAMKVFKKTKSGKKISEEVALQKVCSNADISPKIIDYDTENKFIVMEKMDGHIFDVIHKQYGIITEDQQKQVIRLFKTLDKIHVFHGDANLMNYMYRGSKLYIIDFGYGKEIDDAQIKKLGTSTPNMEIMLLGFVMKLKDMRCPSESYSYLVKFLSPEKRSTYNL